MCAPARSRSVCMELTWLAVFEFLNHPFIWSWIILSFVNHYHLPVVFLMKICLCHIQRNVVHVIFDSLIRMIYSLCLAKFYIMVPLEGWEPSKNHMRGSSGLVSFWRFSFARIPNKLLFLTFIQSSMCCHPLTSVLRCQNVLSFHPSSCLSLGACGGYSMHSVLNMRFSCK